MTNMMLKILWMFRFLIPNNLKDKTPTRWIRHLRKVKKHIGQNVGMKPTKMRILVKDCRIMTIKPKDSLGGGGDLSLLKYSTHPQRTRKKRKQIKCKFYIPKLLVFFICFFFFPKNIYGQFFSTEKFSYHWKWKID